MGKTKRLLENHFKDVLTIIPDWRLKEFKVKKKDEENREEVLLSIDDDASFTWDQAGVALTGK
eukprot:7077867-Karenia_brevis.AAC.1